MNYNTIIIDGNLYGMRAFKSDGVIGDCLSNLVDRLSDKFAPFFIYPVFDPPQGSASVRKEEYPEYKGNRKKTPDEFFDQLQLCIRDLVARPPLDVHRSSYYEADDLAYTLALQSDGPVLLCSMDKDWLQCVSPQCSVLKNPWAKNLEDEIIDHENIKGKTGLTSLQWTSYLGLVGDACDNIPGCDGIGHKRALELINAYPDDCVMVDRILNGDDDELHSLAASVSAQAVRSACKIILQKDKLKLSRELVRLRFVEDVEGCLLIG